MSNDAISTIALGVDTKTGKAHLDDLRAAFAGLKKDLLEFNQLRSNPEALSGGAGEAKSALATLNAELQRTKAQVTSLQNELASLSKSQVDTAQRAAQAVRTVIESKTKATVESEKKAAEATQRLAKETTTVLQQEAEKQRRYSMGRSAKIDGTSYSLKESSNEKDFLAAMTAAEKRRREIAQNSQIMMIADVERAEQRKREITRTANAMMMAEIDRAESLAEQKRRIANEMLMATIDRNNDLALAKQRTANEMMIAEIERAEARKRAIRNNDFNTAPLSSQVRTLKRAKGLVDGGDRRLAEELYGADAVNALGKLNDLEAALALNLHKSSDARKEAAAQTKAYTHTLNEAHSAARGLAGGLGALWLTWGSVVPLVAGAAVTGSMVKVYQVGKDVEFQLQFLRALASDLEREPINIENFLKVTDGGLTSIKDAAEGMRSLAQAGLNQKEALAALPEVLNLAMIGEMGVSDAAVTATGTLDAFGMEIDQIGRVGDVFARIAASSNTSVQAMTESMKQASTVGEQFGLTLEEASATMGVLAQRNIIGSSAGTALTNALKSLYEPTDRAAKALKQLNITTDDGSGGLKSYTQLMQELSERMATLNDSGKAVFLGEIADQRGAKALSAVAANFKGYQQFLSEAQSANGFMQQSTLEMMDTVEAASRRIKAAMEGSFMKAFTNASPVVRQVQEDLAGLAKSQEVVDAMTRLSIATARVTLTVTENMKAIGWLVAAYAGVKIASSVSNSLLVFRAAQQAASIATTAGTLANTANAASITAVGAASTTSAVGLTRFAAGARLASSAFGPIALLVMGAYTAYELYNATLSKSDAEHIKANNTAVTTLDYYDKQIASLKELNRQLEDSGDNAIEAANKTVMAQLNAQRLAAQLDVDRLQAAQPAGGTTRLKTRSGIVDVAASTSNRAPDSKELQEAKARLAQLDNKITEVAQKGYQLSEEKAKNDRLTKRKSVTGEVESLIRMAEGGTDETKKLLPTLQSMLDRVKGEQDAYLAVMPELDKIKQQINKGLNPYLSSNGQANSDAYRAAQARLDGELQAIKNGEKFATEAYRHLGERGEIGELQGIAANLAIVKKARQDELDVFIRKEALAAGEENRKADRQAIENKANDTQAQIGDATARAEQLRLNVLNKYGQESLKMEADTLRKRGDLVGAYVLEYQEKTSEALKKVDLDLTIPDLTDKERAILNERRELILQSYGVGYNSNSFEQTQAEYDEMLASMREGIAEVQEKASRTNGFLSDVGAVQMADALREQTLPAANELLERMAMLADALGDKKLKAEVAEMGRELVREARKSTEAWIAAGKSIEHSLTSAFGKGGKAVGGVISALVKQKAQQKEIDDQLKKSKSGTDDPLKQIALEQKAREESSDLQISSYADMAGAAKGFFDEQSKGYKVLQTAEQVFRAFEAAKALESFVMKTFFAQSEAQVFAQAELEKAIAADTSAASIIAAAMAEGQASATAGVANQAQGDPYTAWARMAMMAASMAALGFATGTFGGGGSGGIDIKKRQSEQGTGTVFGDSEAKSDSIRRAMEALEENSNIALDHSSGMLAALQNIEYSMVGLSNLVLRSAGLTSGNSMDIFEGTVRVNRGDPLMRGLGIDDSLLDDIAPLVGKLHSLWGKTTQKIADSGLSINGTVSDLMGGRGIQQYADIEQKKTSWFGLKKKFSSSTQTANVDADLAQQFALVFGGISDALVEAAGPLKLNAETLRRQIESSVISLPKISLRDLKGEELQEALNAVISGASDTLTQKILPGFEDFRRIGEGYFETVIRVSSGIEVAGAALEKFGLTAVNYTEVVNKQGDTATEIIRSTMVRAETASSGVFSSLMGWAASVKTTGIGEIISEMSGSASDLVDAYRKLVDVRRTMNAMNLDGDGVSRDMVRGAGTLDALSEGVNSYLENFFSEGEQAAIRTEMLGQEFAKLNQVMPASKDQFKALINSLDLTDAADQKLYGSLVVLAGQFADLADDAGVVSAQLSRQKQVVDDLLKAATRWLDTSRKAKDLLKDLDSALSDGNVDNADRIAELWNLMGSTAIDFDQKLELAGELKDLVLEKYRIERENAESLIEFGQDLREYVRDLKLGDKSPLTNRQKLEEASGQYNETLLKAAAGDTDAQAQLQSKADTLLDLARTYYASGSDYTNLFGRVTAQLEELGLGSINEGTSLQSLSQSQLTELQDLRVVVKQISDRADAEYANATLQLKAQLTVLDNIYTRLGVLSQVPDILSAMPAELAAAMSGFVRVNGSHAAGLDFVPYDGYVAELHYGERVVTAAEARRTDKSAMAASVADTANVAALVAEIAALREEVARFREEQREHTSNVIRSNFEANHAAADKVVSGMEDANQSAAWQRTLKPEFS